LDKCKSKLIVKDPALHTHRCLPASELRDKGLRASNQVSKQQGLLKDAPAKLSLKDPVMGIQEVPPLAVVANPSVDRAAKEMGVATGPALPGELDNIDSGFFPGPYEDLSWMLEKNQIPIRDYERQKFKDLKGQDFK
jgi:hypothetical protein